MAQLIRGIHHITVIAGNTQNNFDFNSGILGMRMVKKTINFDDPYTYHLYYGDAVGSPGGIMTFFPWEGAKVGKLGSGMMSSTYYAVNEGSEEFWLKRLNEYQVKNDGVSELYGQSRIAFADREGLQMELLFVNPKSDKRLGYGGVVPEDYAIKGFAGAQLKISRPEATIALLTQLMGYAIKEEEGNRVRLNAIEETEAPIIDLEIDKTAIPGRQGAGIVHHIAFAVDTEKEQLEIQRQLQNAGLQVTEVRDRNYFKSIYFREPSGILFEIATRPPGFGVDESNESLGESLMLPEWYEGRRSEIEQHLPPLKLNYAAFKV
ncbi:MAG: ring-cleaving dioxygenase [Cyclobacteriaceae bacterium]|nr:ring-cleaving dioxygenase [Cyclobacteriaceae bacterium]MCH8517736.1 ring-cleaving dioxygenase [Cyclobacteriaceae bacterium]